MSHVTKAAGIEVFDRSQKNDSAFAGTSRLVKDRSRKSGSIQECSLTTLVPGARQCYTQQTLLLFAILPHILCQ